jgi:hypothetical protein
VNARSGYLLALAGSLLFKIIVGSRIGLTGDEAYYYVYGSFPSLGYYDHPPMIAWILHLVMYLGKSELVLRVPTILFSTLVGPGILALLKDRDETKAYLVATLYLISPLNLLYVLVTTDTPLYLFSFLSAFFFHKALNANRTVHFALSGAFLGCAFLSKYFAVFLGISYLVYVLAFERTRARIPGILVLYLSLLPFAALNLYWNYTHSWVNVLFNLFNRNAGERFAFSKVALNAAMQLYLVTPPIAWLLWKKRRTFPGKWSAGDHLRVYAFLFAFPVLVFTAMSLVKKIGLHWTLSFHPFLFVALFVFLDGDDLRKGLRWMGIYSLAHVALVAVVLALPYDTWKGARFHKDIVFLTRGAEIAERLRPYDGRYRLATTGYMQSATMSYHFGKYFFVFGTGSHNGRQDDLLTDFRELDGENILIFSNRKVEAAAYAPFFASLEVADFQVDGIGYWYMLGRDFRYAAYRDGVLTRVRDTYYDIPGWLPRTPSFFYERYFPADARAR